MERTTCPKCGYTRQPSDTAPTTECPRCGIVFAKYRQHLVDHAAGRRPTHVTDDEADNVDGLVAQLAVRLFSTPQQANSTTLAGECLLAAALVVWGMYFISCDWRSGEAGMSFLHNVNLAFHEFGHLLFRPFGEWMMYLGGSLFQCMVPLLLGIVFVWREAKPYSAAVCLWWIGQNLIDVAPYIGDARAMDLPLIGEWNEEMIEARAFRHDWHNLLEPLGMLSWDHRLAALAHWLGAAFILLAWLWMAWWLWQSWQLVRQQSAQS
ncbi:zinc ribbon domain-containing protein [Chitinimonas sp. BJB300]|uniref:zinc ribbon domain-containing protein n=1 Tax=Chitinimonas sp. BJB300 TaxID=1559339 RepID=UPI000C0D7820|nr:zinc ribbon domain-containing protein [Chitinimonas sp. BJB300]PHV10257.1 zinc ribbon domain-containing protein [Chitinimonas sp. BJB300]TSJ87396.1 zinc ribbon domain-containing protein [Chitinimonas sp. BJB300]